MCNVEGRGRESEWLESEWLGSRVRIYFVCVYVYVYGW